VSTCLDLHDLAFQQKLEKNTFFSSLEKNNRSADGWLNLEIVAVNMSYCTAAVFRDKPYMYMNNAFTPFMYMYTQFMYRCESCFQGTPSKRTERAEQRASGRTPERPEVQGTDR
jgi:hypothetical protein